MTEKRKAKHYPFSLSEDDQAYEILEEVTGNRSEWLRDAVEFKMEYEARRYELPAALAFYDQFNDEPVEAALAIYQEGGVNGMMNRLTTVLEIMLAEKLDQLSLKLAARGIDARQEVAEMKVMRSTIDDLVGQFDDQF